MTDLDSLLTARGDADSFEQLAEQYATWARRTRLAESSQKVYVPVVRRFAAWLDEHGPEYAEAFTDRDVRDFAARTYQKRLLTTEKKAPATAATHMAAVNSFFIWGGIGKPEVGGVEVPPQRKLGLEDDDLAKVLRRARRHGPRDDALMHVLFGAAVRVSECSNLDVDDVAITERTGVALVRHGKGGKTREVTLNQSTRVAIRAWLDVRPRIEGVDALFIGKRGARLMPRGIERVAERIAGEAGVPFTPHTLRHTYGRRYMENGGDIVTLSSELGHARLDTTAIYARATVAQREAAAERVSIDL